MKHFTKLAEGLDVSAALVDVQNHMNLFRKKPVVPTYEKSNEEVDGIVLRTYGGEDLPACSEMPEVKKLAEYCVANFLPKGCKLTLLMVNKLEPGTQIYPHIDLDPLHYPEFFSQNNRHHIVLKTNPGVNFFAGDETLHMNVGECWRFNNQVDHKVQNFGDEWRTHIVFDAWYENPFYLEYR